MVSAARTIQAIIVLASTSPVVGLNRVNNFFALFVFPCKLYANGNVNLQSRDPQIFPKS